LLLTVSSSGLLEGEAVSLGGKMPKFIFGFVFGWECFFEQFVAYSTTSRN